MPAESLQAILPSAATALAAAALLSAAADDLDRRIIPNAAVLAVAAAGLLFLAGLSPPAAAAHLGIAALGLLAGLPAFARGLVGGGDVKLFSATLLWAGPDLLRLHLAGTALAAVLLGVVLLGRQALAARGPDPAAPAPRPTMPFGVALAAGGLLVVLVRAGLLGDAA